MLHAQVVEPPADESVGPPMTWKEICERYPDQWVVVVDVERVDHEVELRAARVVAHDARRAVAYAAADPVTKHAQHSACHFTGRKRAPLAPIHWL